ncbi:MAG: sugar ABC transporter ATP-binding protein [Spirochaetia bacterium]|nr:sugar ABC transporter ATP-binding protein [Spirochaetia bacterium]
MNHYVMEVRNINKAFAGNEVLKDVSFDIIPGEVHTLIGENGAGKSTLMKIIGGIYSKDSGTILYNGQQVEFTSPIEAMQSGISIVHQELSLAENISVAQNIYCHREPKNSLGFIQWEKLYSMAHEVFEKMGIEIDPKVDAGTVSVAKQQLVEIGKALSHDSKVIIMDEPTSSLSDKEVEYLYSIIDNLKQQNVAIVFISHKLQEVFKVSDRITVLRDGQIIDTMLTSETNQDEVIHKMVGRHMDDLYPEKSKRVGDVIMHVEKFCCTDVYSDISFQVRKGEILGMAGLVGAGRTEIARGIIGADPRDSGTIRLDGKEVHIKNCRDAIANGIGYVTEDRKLLGLFQSMPVRWNIVSASLKKIQSAFGFIDNTAISSKAAEFIELMDIRPKDDSLHVVNLSGGNQQKALLAKWLCSDPKVLIVDEPTRGVDVGAKSHIHNYLRKLADQGIGVIVISSEQPEILGLCDRVLVISDGVLTRELDNSSSRLTQEDIMKYATGKGANDDR